LWRPKQPGHFKHCGEPKVHGAEMGIEFQATLSIPNDWRFGTALAIGRDPAGANRIQAMLSDLAGGEW
jgi:hypothetical protein